MVLSVQVPKVCFNLLTELSCWFITCRQFTHYFRPLPYPLSILNAKIKTFYQM